MQVFQQNGNWYTYIVEQLQLNKKHVCTYIFKILFKFKNGAYLYSGIQ